MFPREEKRRDHLVWTEEKRGIYAQVCSHTGSTAHRNSKLRKKRKKRQIRDSKQEMKTETAKWARKIEVPKAYTCSKKYSYFGVKCTFLYITKIAMVVY